MSELTVATYAIYLTAAVGSQAAGTVINAIRWNGTDPLEIPSGTSWVLDSATPPAHPIGSVYTPPAST